MPHAPFQRQDQLGPGMTSIPDPATSADPDPGGPTKIQSGSIPLF